MNRYLTAKYAKYAKGDSEVKPRKEQPTTRKGNAFHELRSPSGMKTTRRNSRVRRTIEDEEEDEKEKDHLQWA
jgi:hypothetical protein